MRVGTTRVHARKTRGRIVEQEVRKLRIEDPLQIFGGHVREISFDFFLQRAIVLNLFVVRLLVSLTTIFSLSMLQATDRAWTHLCVLLLERLLRRLRFRRLHRLLNAAM